MKKAVRTMKKHRSFVDNAIVNVQTFSNGLIEGINNKIKVIKRIAFGYRSFVHFKNRILITQNMVNLKQHRISHDSMLHTLFICDFTLHPHYLTESHIIYLLPIGFICDF
jgi:hypothetical protein